MTKKYDGTIKITIDPEDDLEHIQKLPYEERKYALKYLFKSFENNLKLLQYSIDEFGKALLGANHIHIPSVREGLEVLFRKNKNPLWPKEEKGWQKWRKVKNAMDDLDKKYKKLDIRKPTYKEYADFLAEKGLFGYKGKPYDERILREIIRASKDGYLN